MTDSIDVNAKLLHALLTAHGPMAIETLGCAASMNPTQVSAQLDALGAAGCEVAIDPARGVTLVRTDPRVWSDYLRDMLLGGRGRIIEVYGQTSSTQDAARRIVRSGGACAQGAVVLADEQTAGRGRLGRAWVAPRGTCALMSMVHVPDANHANVVERLFLAVSVAVSDAVIEVAPEADARIKWPNDVVIDSRKVAGIIIETIRHHGDQTAIIGVGVNVSLQHDDLPADLRDTAASLAMSGCATDRLLVIRKLVDAIDKRIAQADTRELLDTWRGRTADLSQRVTLRCNGTTTTGQVLDLDARDGLILRTDAGQIVHLPAATTTVV